jgi:hypothetical protein
MWPKTDVYRWDFIVAVSIFLGQAFLLLALVRTVQNSTIVTAKMYLLGLYTFFQGHNSTEKHTFVLFTRAVNVPLASRGYNSP